MKKSVFIVLCFALLFACSNETVEISSVEDESINESKAVETDITEAVEEKPAETDEPDKTETTDAEGPLSVSIDEQTVAGAFTPSIPVGNKDISHTTEFHNQYLDDQLVFKEVEKIELNSDELGIIGYESAFFYPHAGDISAYDAYSNYGGLDAAETSLNETLGEGIKIPIGSVVTILEIRTFVYFEENYNSFYLVNWDGATGLVFGADIFRAPKNEIELYRHFLLNDNNNFIPFTGRTSIREDLQETLIEQKFSINDLPANEYYSLSDNNPDDMISLYKKDMKDNWKTMFYTTDFFAHVSHILFANILKDTEQEIFYTKLRQLISLYLKHIREYRKIVPEEDENFHKLIDLTEVYFMIPEALLAMSAMAEDENKNKSAPEITDAIIESVMELYPENVQEELHLILNAKGFDMSPNFGYREDYSQFIVRGHYTESERLGAYFKSMMWFGRIHMLFQKYPGDNEIEYPLGYLAQTAMFITKISYDNEDLFNRWNALFDPITYLVGAADDYSLKNTEAGLAQIPWSTFNNFIEDKEAVSEFADWAFANLPKPQISGNSVFSSYADSDPVDEAKNQHTLGEPPSGFRLFGQRFTFDSVVHQAVSPPRLQQRYFISGLDFLYALGIKNLEDKIRIHEITDNGGAALSDLFFKLDKQKEFFENQENSFWNQSYYLKVLEMIRQQAKFQTDAGYYFTQHENWNKKAYTAALGQWAELRHDTILYVKQVYGEGVGGGDIEYTYRYIEPYTPIHYVEPNTPFYYTLQETLSVLTQIIEHYNLDIGNYERKIEYFSEIAALALRVSQSIHEDMDISVADNNALKTLPSRISYVALREGAFGGMFTQEEKKYRMAVIADVYTHADSQQVLEVGVGKPRRLLVALNDGHGGKRIARGYTFSYYEFKHPMDDRLTNDTWRKWIYDDKIDMSPYLPIWDRDYSEEQLQAMIEANAPEQDMEDR